jgi:hypothetical protein
MVTVADNLLQGIILGVFCKSIFRWLNADILIKTVILNYRKALQATRPLNPKE